MAVALLTLAPAGARAAGTADDDAKTILKAMSDYVSSRNTISLTFDSSIEAITPFLEKIQFASSGEVLVSRPDKLSAHRVGVNPGGPANRVGIR